jgi:hypothetical protein
MTYTFEIKFALQNLGDVDGHKGGYTPSINLVQWMFRVFGGGLRNDSLWVLPENSHNEENGPERFGKTSTSKRVPSSGWKLQQTM